MSLIKALQISSAVPSALLFGVAASMPANDVLIPKEAVTFS
jgi:hypothetical protein